MLEKCYHGETHVGKISNLFVGKKKVLSEKQKKKDLT